MGLSFQRDVALGNADDDGVSGAITALRWRREPPQDAFIEFAVLRDVVAAPRGHLGGRATSFTRARTGIATHGVLTLGSIHLFRHC